MGTGTFPGVQSGRGMTLTPHPLLGLKQSRVIHLFFLRAFLACKKGKTYLLGSLDGMVIKNPRVAFSSVMLSKEELYVLGFCFM
jgi:hypothetical protein